MNLKLKLTSIFLALSLNACATVTNGTTQELTFDLSEASGECTVLKANEAIGKVSKEDPKITVQRSKAEILLKCNEFEKKYEPKINAAGYTSITLIDFGIVDFLTGALWEYQQ